MKANRLWDKGGDWKIKMRLINVQNGFNCRCFYHTYAIMIKRMWLMFPIGNIKSIMAILKKNEYIDNFKLIDDKKQE